MKKVLLFLTVLTPLFAGAQDSLAPKNEMKAEHEFGVNTTLLLKQVFNLSNNTFTTLPYDITYKRIVVDKAWRFGIGLALDNLNSENSTSTTGGSTTPGPDPTGPTYMKSTEVFFRAGWEKQWQLEKRLVCYAGVDIAGMFGMSGSQTIFVFNNLPNSYSYQRTTISKMSMEGGGGAVAGIQYFLGKRVSVSTEIPLYVMYSYSKEETEDYTNFFNGFNYTATTDKETETLNGIKASITLPVTLYLSVKF